MDNTIMEVAAFGLLTWFFLQVVFFAKMAKDEA